MIVTIWEGVKKVTTNGCDCCSCDYDFHEVDEIRKELIENITVAIKACKAIGIDFNEILEEANQKGG